MNNKIDKNKLLNSLREKIVDIQDKVYKEKEKIKEISNKSISEIKSLNPEDQQVYMNLRGNSQNRLNELDQLNKSPFFVRCDLSHLGDRDGERVIYFSKHNFSEQEIFSWISPIASIRFEKPGKVKYRIPSGKIEETDMNRKEQYLIVDVKVIFYALEDGNNPRELIFQEHFSKKKDTFALPEIIAIMEKAQDAVIRAHHTGPFVISGPAGSGKTTLALHRVAYLVQSPDTSHLYPDESVLVFVQDNGTKEYFSKLLPELGINNVRITTFHEWALTILGFPDAKVVRKRGDDEYERIRAMRNKEIPTWENMKKELKKLEKTGLDRIDITMAMISFKNKFGKYVISTKHNVVSKSGEIVIKKRKHEVKYSLVILDEFQNYMPEQIRLVNGCLDENTKSIIYVGDMAQQVLSGTIRSFDDADVSVETGRHIQLHKVYRNTKEILQYIGTLGYKVEIPEGMRSGPRVKELGALSIEKVIDHIRDTREINEGTIGVIFADESLVSRVGLKFTDSKGIHILSIPDSQGVEFETVIFILSDVRKAISVGHEEEMQRIEKDLHYVALTRAVNELHIIKSCQF